MSKRSKELINLAEQLTKYKIDIEELDINTLRELKENFDFLDDKRNESYISHSLSDIVLLTLLAVLANADEWTKIEDFGKKKKEWLRKFLELPNGIPSHDTIQRVIAIVNPKQLNNICVKFLINKLEKLYNLASEPNQDEETEILSFDGKELVGSKRKETDKGKIKALQSLNVYSTKYRMCLAQVFIEEKTNEIPAMIDILDLVNVEGAICTWDALNTQKATVEKVIKNRGNYVGALKGNQHNFYNDVVDFFTEEEKTEIKKDKKNYKKTIAKENSAVITREYYVSGNIEWLYNKEKWAGLKAIGLEQKTIKKLNGEEIIENRYFIISFNDNIEEFARAVRKHWGVENELHWHLDYTFKEDDNTTAEKDSLKNLDIIRKVALGILKTVQCFYNKSLKRIRYDLSLDFEREIEKIFKLLNVEQLETLLK